MTKGPEVIAQIVPKSAGRIVVAHVSDLHLEIETDTAKDPWPALRESLRSNPEPIDLIVVTGDLVELPGLGFVERIKKKITGNDRELSGLFSQAKEYLEDLCRAAEVDPETQLLVVPGNHDVRRMRGVGWFDPAAFEAFE